MNSTATEQTIKLAKNFFGSDLKTSIKIYENLNPPEVHKLAWKLIRSVQRIREIYPGAGTFHPEAFNDSYGDIYYSFHKTVEDLIDKVLKPQRDLQLPKLSDHQLKEIKQLLGQTGEIPGYSQTEVLREKFIQRLPALEKLAIIKSLIPNLQSVSEFLDTINSKYMDINIEKNRIFEVIAKKSR